MVPTDERRRARWLPQTVLFAALALVGAACGGTDEGSASGGSGNESEQVEEVVETEPVPDPNMPLLEVTAAGTAFDTDRLVAPAGEPFQILLHNQDTIEHNVSIYPVQDGRPLFSQELYQGEFGDGPVTLLYEVPALDAGKYIFYCDAHLAEQMKGDFIVR